MSGPDFPMGQDALKGIQAVLAMDPVLKNGDRIELVVEDDRNEPALSVLALKKLSEQDNVVSVMVLSGSASSLAIDAIADRYQIPVLVLLSTHADIAKGRKYLTQICFDNSIQGRVAALFVRDELLIERVGVLYSLLSDHSISLADEFVRKFRDIGGEVVAQLPVGGNQADLMTTLENMRHKQVQLLYLPVSSDIFTEISRALEALKWQVERMGRDGLVANLLLKHPKQRKLFEGVLSIDMFAQDIEMTGFGRRAHKLFHSIFGTSGSTFAALGAEGMAILQNAMNKCQSKTDRECINRMVRGTHNFEGVMGRLAVRSDGKTERPLIVNRIREGRNYSLVKVY